MKILINGCFDLFHDGHKYLIHKAQELAGKYGHLIILINSDSSIKKLKGSKRPIDTLEIRLANINGFLDLFEHKFYSRSTLVVFDSEAELVDYIDHFQPDIIIKGDDRSDVRTIVGHGKYPILFLPCLKDAQGKKISTSTKLDKK